MVQAADLALEEHLTNVMNYAYEDTREHEIVVRLETSASDLVIEVEDDGKRCEAEDVLGYINAILDAVDTFGMKWPYARYLANARLSIRSRNCLVVENPEPIADGAACSQRVDLLEIFCTGKAFNFYRDIGAIFIVVFLRPVIPVIDFDAQPVMYPQCDRIV